MGYEGSGEAEVDLPAVSAVDPVRPLPEVYAAEPESTEAADPVGADLDLDVQPAPTAETLRQAAEEVAPRNVEVDPAILVQRGVPAARAEVAADPDEAGVLVTTQQAQPVAPAPDRTSPAPQPAGEPPAEPRQPTAAVAPEQDDVAAEPAKPAPAPAAEKEPPTSPAAVTKRDRPGTVAADVRSGNGSSDGSGNGAAGRKPEQPERAGGDGEVAGAGSDGPGRSPPEGPLGPQEMEPTGPSPLAVAIGNRWIRDNLGAEDIEGTRLTQESALGAGLTTPMSQILATAYTAFVDRYLQSPANAIDPAGIADMMLAVPGIDRNIDQALGTERSLAFRRDLTRAIIMIQVNRWNQGPNLEKDSLEFERVRPQAREVADRYGVPLDVVYDYPESGTRDLYAETFQSTYFVGPTEYILERKAMSARGGYAQTRLEVYFEAVIGSAIDAGFVNFAALDAISPANMLVEEYQQRIYTSGTYDEYVQRRLETKQQLAAAFTLAKVEEIWGPTVPLQLAPTYQEWLTGQEVGSRQLLPPGDRNLLEQAELLEQRIITTAPKTELTDNEIGTLAKQAAIRIARAGDLSDDNVVMLTQVLDEVTKIAAIDATPDKVATLHTVDDENIEQTNQIRLGVDTRAYGLLGTSYIRAGLFETAINPATGRHYNDAAIGTYRANALREALVLREMRLLYPQLFPRRARANQGAGYYESKHFADAQRLVRRIAEPYFDLLLLMRYGKNI